MMQAVVAGRIENLVKFPPRQKPASFNLDAAMRDPEAAGGGKLVDQSFVREVLTDIDTTQPSPAPYWPWPGPEPGTNGGR